MPSSSSVPARAAASVLLLRDAGDYLEVLMVQRPARGFFGGLMVFPGGAVEDCDRAASGAEGEEFLVAAIRETAEEVGLLLTAEGSEPAPPLRGTALLEEIGQPALQQARSRLTLISRWLTPEFAPKRFDTRFFVAGIKGNPDVILDQEELISHSWTTPSAALAHSEQGSWELILPTIAHLRWLARWRTTGEAVRAARGADGGTIIEPVSLDDGSLAARYRGER